MQADDDGDDDDDGSCESISFFRPHPSLQLQKNSTPRTWMRKNARPPPANGSFRLHFSHHFGELCHFSGVHEVPDVHLPPAIHPPKTIKNPLPGSNMIELSPSGVRGTCLRPRVPTTCCRILGGPRSWTGLRFLVLRG